MSMGGVDRMLQNILAYLFNLGTKRQWWPHFRFFVDVAINDTYQIYCQSHLHHGGYRLDALGIYQAIVCYCLHRQSLSFTTLFKSIRILHHPSNSFQFNGMNYWIVKGSQQLCSLSECKGTTVYCCKKCDVGLHVDCFELYHCIQSSL